jgi:uncharacterized membrane protein YbhN (UPF0104 family)
LVINLLSPLAKGLSWHLLLSRVAPNRWWVAQEANLVGTAVNSVAAGVSGEAARVAMVVEREGVPVRGAVVSVAWSRGVEALGLALFLLIAPLVLRLPPTLRGLQLAAGLVLATALAAARFRGWELVVSRLPASVRAAARDLAEMSRGPRLLAPVGLALVSWAAEWACYHLAFRAAHLHVSYAASFTALMAVNLGGVIRVTPANVGLMQAAIVGALLPFGIDPDRAVAAGLALQAIEVFPVLALTLPIIGRAGLKRLRAEAGRLPDVA